MEYEHILYNVEGPIATITLNRPEKLNAYSEAMVQSMLKAVDDARNGNDVRVLVVTGAGRGFCSGGDISPDFQYPARFRGQRMESLLEMRENFHQLVYSLRRFDKPSIAAVNGPAVAGGLTLALCCDFRIASDRARLGDTSLRFALIPDEGGAYLFPMYMGLEHALKMSLLSEVYDAQEALRLGLVTEVVPHDQLMVRTRELAARLAAGPPLALRVTKRMMYKQMTMDLENALEDAALGTIITNYSEDAREGVQAFHEKRPPRFQGK